MHRPKQVQWAIQAAVDPVKRPIMQPDKLHFHHLLNKRFKNHLIVVLILSFIQIIFASIGIFIFIYKLYLIGFITLGGLIIAASIYTMINTKDMAKKKRKMI